MRPDVFLKAAQTIYSGVVHLAALVALACLALITLGIGAEAILRSLDQGSLRGVVDLAEHGMFSMVFLAAPWVLVHDAHIRVDLMPRSFRGRPENSLKLVREAVAALMCAYLTYVGLRVLMTSYARGEFIFQELVIPEWWLQWQVPLSFGLMAIEFARRFFLRVKRPNVHPAEIARF